MKAIVTIAMLVALSACQANEPQHTAPATAPADNAQGSAESQPAAAMPDTESVKQAAKQAVEQGKEAVKQATGDMQQKAAQAASQAARTASKVQAEASKQVSSALAAAKPAAAPASSSAAPSIPTASKLPVSKPAMSEMPAASAPVVDNAKLVADGKALSRKCAVCHNFDAKAKVGPGLGGVFGRQAGSMPGFSYTFAGFIKPGQAWHWDAAHLSRWMCDAPAAIKEFTGNASARTRMPAQRVCDADKQAALIAYLKTL